MIMARPASQNTVDPGRVVEQPYSTLGAKTGINMNRYARLLSIGLVLVSMADAAQNDSVEPTMWSSLLLFLPIVIIIAIAILVARHSGRRTNSTIDRYLTERARRIGPHAAPSPSADQAEKPGARVTSSASLIGLTTTASVSPVGKATAPELRPYDVNAPCPACGVVGAKTRFKRAGGEFNPSTGRSADVMLRTCGNCGYKWKERAFGDQAHRGK